MNSILNVKIKISISGNDAFNMQLYCILHHVNACNNKYIFRNNIASAVKILRRMRIFEKY